jgi:hypothetical protein
MGGGGWIWLDLVGPGWTDPDRNEGRVAAIATAVSLGVLPPLEPLWSRNTRNTSVKWDRN